MILKEQKKCAVVLLITGTVMFFDYMADGRLSWI